MEIVLGSGLFLLIGIAFIKFFHERNKNAAQTVDEFAKTHYYNLLESINRLHPDKKKNAEQIADFTTQIFEFETTYSNLPATKVRVARLRTDLQLKEEELFTKLHQQTLAQVN